MRMDFTCRKNASTPKRLTGHYLPRIRGWSARILAGFTHLYIASVRVFGEFPQVSRDRAAPDRSRERTRSRAAPQPMREFGEGRR